MIGILGGGQLGRMLALAAAPLGHKVLFLEPASDAPAATIADHVNGAFDDPRALDELAARSDVVTYEFENVPLASAESLARRVPVRPSPRALEVSQDRLSEKCFFQSLGIATPDFQSVSSADELERACQRIAFPAVLKTRRLGYDGKGQRVLRDEQDVAAAIREMEHEQLILEAFVPFDRELSIVAVRDLQGEMACYPLVENLHQGGVLRVTRAPAPGLTPTIEDEARRMVRAILEKLDYVGVVALELFQWGDDLMANEMAPRVHNSGHWTIEGAQTSQFENHIRAVAGLPLGATSLIAPCVMVNLIGTIPPIKEALQIPGAHLHLYDKEPRPGRKVGHITIRGSGDFDLEQSVKLALALVTQVQE